MVDPPPALHPADLVLVRRARDRIDDGGCVDVHQVALDLGTTVGHLGALFVVAYGESLRSYAAAPRRRLG